MATYYFSRKFTEWENANVPEELEDEFMEKINSDGLEAAVKWLEAEQSYDLGYEDCMAREEMTVQDNKGEHTLELWNYSTDSPFPEFTNKPTDNIGINLRSLLDGAIAAAINEGKDLSNYDVRNELIDYVQEQIDSCEWISTNINSYHK